MSAVAPRPMHVSLDAKPPRVRNHACGKPGPDFAIDAGTDVGCLTRRRPEKEAHAGLRHAADPEPRRMTVASCASSASDAVWLLP